MDHIKQYGFNNNIQYSHIKHAVIGDCCHIFNTTIIGTEESPVVIGNNVVLLNCYVVSDGQRSPFTFWNTRVDINSVRIEDNVCLTNSHILNSHIGSETSGFGASINYSDIGKKNSLRNFANITHTKTAEFCDIASEVSKTIIEGKGFVSEHNNSYLSLFAPSNYPIIDEYGKEKLLPGLPNVSNIGSGTVFANYGGEPLPTADLLESNQSRKGTAILYTAFTAINSRIINRYEQPGERVSPFDILRRCDVTILGFGCFVEDKVTGRIPAFSYASDTSASTHSLGWVLDTKPGIILNFIRKMKEKLNNNFGDLQELIPGTLRLERELLLEELNQKRRGFYSPNQIKAGLRIIDEHLKDGRWEMDENGAWIHQWSYNPKRNEWSVDLG